MLSISGTVSDSPFMNLLGVMLSLAEPEKLQGSCVDLELAESHAWTPMMLPSDLDIPKAKPASHRVDSRFAF